MGGRERGKIGLQPGARAGRVLSPGCSSMHGLWGRGCARCLAPGAGLRGTGGFRGPGGGLGPGHSSVHGLDRELAPEYHSVHDPGVPDCDLIASKAETWQQLGSGQVLLVVRGIDPQEQVLLVAGGVERCPVSPQLRSEVSAGQRNLRGGARAPAEPAGFSHSPRAGEGL